MTQNSWCWECTGVGDGDARTVNDIINQNMLLGNLQPSENGVIYWRDSTPFQGFSAGSGGLLAPSNPAGNTVRIGSGAAIVQGWLYVSDANVDFDVSGGAANATDLIVLRRGDPASVSSVRLALKRGPGGGSATVTQTAATWEIAIAEVLLDGAGDFSALTNVRKLAYPPVGSMTKIEEIEGDGTFTNVTFSSIPSIFSHLRIVGTAKSNEAVVATVQFGLIFNNDAGNNYQYIINVENNAGTNNAQAGAATEILLGSVTTFKNDLGNPVFVDQFSIDINNYANTTLYKTMNSVVTTFSTTAPNSFISDCAGWYLVETAINRIDLFFITGSIKNWSPDTKITLYGLV